MRWREEEFQGKENFMQSLQKSPAIQRRKGQSKLKIWANILEWKPIYLVTWYLLTYYYNYLLISLVVTDGMPMMPKLCAENWDSIQTMNFLKLHSHQIHWQNMWLNTWELDELSLQNAMAKKNNWLIVLVQVKIVMGALPKSSVMVKPDWYTIESYRISTLCNYN